MKIVFTEPAKAELFDAAAYYELEYKGFGKLIFTKGQINEKMGNSICDPFL